MLHPNTEYYLEHHLHRNTTHSHVIYITVLIVFVVVAVLLPFIKVNISVQGEGIIRPVAEKTEVKTLTSEMIEDVFIREGQFVARDSPILRLNTRNIDAKLEFLCYQQRETEGFVHDLNLIINGATIDPTSFASLAYKHEYRHYLRQVEELRNKRDKACKEFLRNKHLYESEVIAEKDFDDFRFHYTTAENEYKIYTNGRESKLQADLNRYQQLLSEIRSNILQLQKEKEYYSIKAPVSGTVEQFTGIFQGSRLQTGQTVAVISPDSSLISEIYISPKDIGYISGNNPVRIQVDAFNYNEWGIIKGKVTEISSDFIVVNNNPMFRVRCTMDRMQLSLNKNIHGNLKKGMTVRARFLLAKRSLFQLLYEDIDDWINPVQYAKN